MIWRTMRYTRILLAESWKTFLPLIVAQAICATALNVMISNTLHDFALTSFDHAIWLLQDRWGLSLLWFVTPALEIVCLISLSKQPFGAPLIVGLASRKAQCAGLLGAATIIGALFGCSMWLQTWSISLVNEIEFSNVSSPTSLYALFTGAPMAQSPEPSYILGVTLTVCIAVSITYALVASLAISLMSHPMPLLVGTILVGIPNIRGILPSIMRSTSVDYNSWQLSSNHGLWLQLFFCMLAIAIGFAAYRRIDYSSTKRK